MAWTDERMDDMATQVRDGFATVDADIREVRTEIGGLRAELHSSLGELRAEIRGVRAELKGEIAALRTELKGDIADLRTELRGEIAAVRTGMNRWAVVIVATMLGLFGANLVPGVGG